jgi:hypothetical protein
MSEHEVRKAASPNSPPTSEQRVVRLAAGVVPDPEPDAEQRKGRRYHRDQQLVVRP